MIKKIFTIIVTLLFILFTAFILLNKNFANQIVISAEDVYDKVTGDYDCLLYTSPSPRDCS